MIGRISQLQVWGVIAVVITVMSIGLASTTVAAPASPSSLGSVLSSEVEPASFWGLPYPYGYAERPSSCFRHVKVRGRHGVRWKKVWVCR
jgi:hypothetical protein